MQTSSSSLTSDKRRKLPSWNTTPYRKLCIYFCRRPKPAWVLQGDQAGAGCWMGGGSQRCVQLPTDPRMKWLARTLCNNPIALISALLYQAGHYIWHWGWNKLHSWGIRPRVSWLGTFWKNSISSVSGDWIKPNLRMLISISLPSLSPVPVLPFFLPSYPFCSSSYQYCNLPVPIAIS